MADRADDDSPQAPLRTTLTSSDVRHLIDDRVMMQMQGADGQLRPAYDLLRPEWRAVYERLRADPDGNVSAAINRLRKRDPALVLAETIGALQTAARLPLLKQARARAEKHRDRASHLREIAGALDQENPPGTTDVRALDLCRIADQIALDADTTEQSLKNGPWSRKNDDPQTAFVGAAARDLARRLFSNGRADHAAIAALLSAATGGAVPAAQVANALRSTIRTNTRSKDQTSRERAE